MFVEMLFNQDTTRIWQYFPPVPFLFKRTWTALPFDLCFSHLSHTVAKRPGTVNLDYIDHVRRRARLWVQMNYRMTQLKTSSRRTSKTTLSVFNMLPSGPGLMNSKTGAQPTTGLQPLAKRYVLWSMTFWPAHLTSLTRNNYGFWPGSFVNVRPSSPTTTKLCDASGARTLIARSCSYPSCTPLLSGIGSAMVPVFATTAWTTRMIAIPSSRDHGCTKNGTWEIPTTILTDIPTWPAGRTTSRPTGWWRSLPETTLLTLLCYSTIGMKIPLLGNDTPWHELCLYRHRRLGISRLFFTYAKGLMLPTWRLWRPGPLPGPASRVTRTFSTTSRNSTQTSPTNHVGTRPCTMPSRSLDPLTAVHVT